MNEKIISRTDWCNKEKINYLDNIINYKKNIFVFI